MTAKQWGLSGLLALTLGTSISFATGLTAQSAGPVIPTVPAAEPPSAANSPTPGAAPEQTFGPETNQPMPRFVSLKANEANIRRGPSMTHRVDWVFNHPGQPLIVTAEYGHWRRVMDRDGFGGWVHYALLSGTRTVTVDVDMIDLRAQPSLTATVKAKAQRGVIAKLGDCADGWCQIRAGGQRGWVEAKDLWGLELPIHAAGSSVDPGTTSVANAQAAPRPQ
ncbi:SH3 domain-containing protein [Pseudoruegeria sp. SK021]|uniref:SH3 domain-containing protein n=1 Tax=Pseudoruegeria sp. SK021 TaxID=1933035 RepID=UPI000A2326CE|nr:SH3 domain-containing protein [Pseudoruegeria sp. SK021]OSP56056.1 hypothetical protein BV911_03715 [Pseudoruegeria sp. SK021]